MNSSFILDGKPARELGMYMLRSSRRPILSATRDSVQTIPLMAGAYDFGADMEPKLFELECAMITTSAAALQERASELAAFLVNSNGRPRMMELVFTLQPERTYTVRYSGQLPIDRLVGLGRFTLPLIAFDPFAYAKDTAFDVAPGQYDTGLQYDSGLMYENPESFNWIYAWHMSGLYNYSKLTTPLNLSIVGTVTNPTITNQTNGESISLSLTMSPGDKLVINGKKKAITLNDVNAMMCFISGDFPNIVAGNNGLIFIGMSPNANVTYDWQHKFI